MADSKSPLKFIFLDEEEQSNSRGSDDICGTSADESAEQPFVEEEYVLSLDFHLFIL